jgi:hypothetical protein
MGNREAAGGELGEQGLHVAQRRLAGGGIADMADRGGAGEPADHLVLVEIAGDVSHRAVRMEVPAVEAGDPGRLLAPVLEGVEAERDDRRSAVGSPDAEDSALLAKLVFARIDFERMRGQHVRNARSPV